MLGSHTAMLSLYDRISPGKADAVQFYEEKKLEALQNLQIFWDAGKDFCEADSVKYPVRNHRVQVELKLPANTAKLRLDPGELRSGVKIHKLLWDNKVPVAFATEGFRLEEDTLYFGGEDPQIIITEIPEGTSSLMIDLEFLDEKKTGQKFWNAYREQERQKGQLMEELKRKEKLVRTVESSKMWKAYRHVKKI